MPKPHSNPSKNFWEWSLNIDIFSNLPTYFLWQSGSRTLGTTHCLAHSRSSVMMVQWRNYIILDCTKPKPWNGSLGPYFWSILSPTCLSFPKWDHLTNAHFKMRHFTLKRTPPMWTASKEIIGIITSLNLYTPSLLILPVHDCALFSQGTHLACV